MILQKQSMKVSIALHKLQSDSENFSTDVEVWIDLTVSVELLPYKHLTVQMMNTAIKLSF